MNTPNLNEPVEILVVEDSPTQAEKLKHILEKNRHRVSVAHNGKEALEMMREHKPTVVVTDVMMPEMNGYQLCSAIRADENFAQIPVILLTSLSNAEDVVKGLECGADNFITKPYDEKYLLSRIQYIFANWHLREMERTRMGIEVFFAGKKHFITSDRLQILNLLLSTYETAVQRNEELAAAREQLQSLNEKLEDRVQERTAALSKEIVERKRAEEEVMRLNAELEQRVHERTAQLELANKELEGFSYSVSHDLRAPLRALSGFSQMLQTESADQLSPKGKTFLQRISDAASGMNQLIEDLLKLFGVSKGEIKRQSVDLSELATGIASELRQMQSEREAEFVIAPNLIVTGDKSLLRVVLQNLLGNAWKFTEKTDATRIELGVQQEGDKPIYFVRDNGAGFDMAYAGKLFAPFQRLHSPAEFLGTGIGLATVQRIIHRHGGRIWAEGSVNQGATFYFSFEKPQTT